MPACQWNLRGGRLLIYGINNALHSRKISIGRTRTRASDSMTAVTMLVEMTAYQDGGVRRLRSEMTYTATGFSNPVRVNYAPK